MGHTRSKELNQNTLAPPRLSVVVLMPKGWRAGWFAAITAGYAPDERQAHMLEWKRGLVSSGYSAGLARSSILA